MIKYKVWVLNNNEKTDFGIIEGNSKRDLALKLNKLRHKYNIEIENIKLEYLEGKIDNKENL